MSEPVRGVDGLVSCLGAGLFVGLAPAASLAGWWLLAGLALAVGLAVVLPLSTAEPRPGRMAFAATVAGSLGRIAAAVAMAGTAGAYVLPDQPPVAGVVITVVVAAAVALGVRLSPATHWVAAGVVAAVLVVVAVACFTIAPVTQPAAAGSPVGALPAAALLFVCFAGAPRGRSRLAVVGAVLAVCVAVAVGALRQLGPPRLALSDVPLRDVLAAADATALTRLLTVAVTLACAGTVWWALHGLDRRFVAPAGVVIAAGAVLLDPVTALVVAAILLIAESGFGIVGRQSVGQPNL